MDKKRKEQILERVEGAIEAGSLRGVEYAKDRRGRYRLRSKAHGSKWCYWFKPADPTYVFKVQGNFWILPFADGVSYRFRLPNNRWTHAMRLDKENPYVIAGDYLIYKTIDGLYTAMYPVGNSYTSILLDPKRKPGYTYGDGELTLYNVTGAITNFWGIPKLQVH